MSRLPPLMVCVVVACSGETGSGLVEFSAFAGADETTTNPARFRTETGYDVELDQAELHVGALYLNRARPILGAQDTACILPGLYTAEVRSGMTFDALDPKLIRFGEPGHGTLEPAATGEVWLTGGEIDAQNDPTPILTYAGTATKDGVARRFRGVVTIGQNRALPSSDPATPGANPLCKQRIVTPIPVDITPSHTGTLVLRVRPEVWFARVDFGHLPVGTELTHLNQIPDSLDDPTSNTLFQGLRAAHGYRIEWQP